MQKSIGKKILIAEDDALLRSVLVDSFAFEGFEVLIAGNGAEALDTALTDHPDIIMLDIQMPIMDGMEMLDNLRSDEWGKSAEVVLLTNFGDQDRVAKAMEKGALVYLVKKDWKVEDIVNKVKSTLKLV